MAQGNGGGRNEYDIDNEYEQAAPRANTVTPPYAPSVVPKPSPDEFQPRSLPAPAIYIPTLGGSRRDRRSAEDHVRALQIANQVAGASEVLVEGLTKLEEAHQRKELVQLRRTQLPARIEAENLELGKKLLQGRTEFEAQAEQQQEERVKRNRFRQLNAEDFETTLHNKRAARLEAQAREREAEARLAHAEETGKRRAEADLHKANEAAFGKEADAETERRRRDQERQKRGQAAIDPAEDVPADLRAPLRVVQTVAKSREWVDRKIADIKAQAAAEGRPLSRDEIEKIDQLEDAYADGEASIRRRGASDLP